ncbi:MAG: prolyl oligopeptidase family serine peptidase [Ignavibacteriales bacterium]|nr:prolyl oligopeptidase family serine peptidase [Ignavibacteriales bacterium]
MKKNSLYFFVLLIFWLFSRSNSYAQNNFWNDDFKLVQIPSSIDTVVQPAYFLDSKEKSNPLLVSLHTWSGDYTQADSLAYLAKNENWNYIHPNFRGPNNTKDACLSEKAIRDIDDAIQFSIENGNVDKNNIFIVGVSGGGYATLGMYLKTKYKIKSFLAWVPISDISAWYYQTKNRGLKYSQDILNCISGNNEFDENEAKRRSPLFWEIPQNSNGKLEIYAGIRDGYDGSVPITHSISFYNKITKAFGYKDKIVTEEEIIKLLSREIAVDRKENKIDTRSILYKRENPKVSLTIFDGKHEMLVNYCFDRILQISELK